MTAFQGDSFKGETLFGTFYPKGYGWRCFATVPRRTTYTLR